MRIMDVKDRKYFSNPLKGRNFGTTSPPVPDELLSQLVDLQMKDTTPEEHPINNLKRQHADQKEASSNHDNDGNTRYNYNATVTSPTQTTHNFTPATYDYLNQTEETEAKRLKANTLSLENNSMACPAK